MSPADVVNAVSAQNLIVPSGTVKIDRFEYAVETNSSPSIVDQLNDLPLRTANGAIVYVRDVAHVRDGFPPQTNIVRVDGRRAALMVYSQCQGVRVASSSRYITTFMVTPGCC